MPHHFFEGNTYKYILTGIDFASRYKIERILRTKKLEAIYKKVFERNNSSEFKNEVTKLYEKHIADIRRATTKYRHTHTAFVETFNKELAKLLFKPMDAEELKDPAKVSTIWIKNMNGIVKKINNTKSLMINMKPKDAIK